MHLVQLVPSTVWDRLSHIWYRRAGPITKDYTYFWSPPEAAALWSPQPGLLGALQNKTAPPVCPASGNPLSSFR